MAFWARRHARAALPPTLVTSAKAPGGCVRAARALAALAGESAGAAAAGQARRQHAARAGLLRLRAAVLVKFRVFKPDWPGAPPARGRAAPPAHAHSEQSIAAWGFHKEPGAWLLCMACEELADRKGHLALQRGGTDTVIESTLSDNLGVSPFHHH